jgi:hypothetical protein
MESQVEITEVLKFMREQIGDQAQQIAILKATLSMQENPTT